MRILILSQQLAAFRSGVGTYTYGLITGLRDSGHDVTVAVPASEKAKIPGITILSVPDPRFDPTPGGWIRLGISFAMMLHEEAGKFDIAHFSDAREAWRVRRHSIPVTAMVNDSYALDWLDRSFPRRVFADRPVRSLYYRMLRAVERRTYRQLDGLVVNGNYVGRAVVDHYGIDAGKVEPIYIGLPDEMPARPVELAGAPSILFVGGNFQRKGLPVLLRAGALLLPRFPEIRIHVVGKDRIQPSLAQQAEELGIGHTVEFHGRQPNDRVLGMMAAADVFALPSLTEGFGLVYLEAMRSGTPVIATSMGGAREVLAEDSEALFVEPGDAQGLAAAIDRIASGPDIALHLSRGGRAAAKRFTVDTMVQATEEFFIKVLKGSL